MQVDTMETDLLTYIAGYCEEQQSALAWAQNELKFP